ncbi:MAG: Asp-tRNA(Asn)/Glu-tRNA(Gln) amidotransferase subunit GatC [Halobacteria archaeon]|nr:Asp-tRNA(Asn)/Glu-tRNA(Gln) amidotransferase subunit GatC [Halobacteria archaeon]
MTDTDTGTDTQLGRDDVEHIADLARIDLDEDEVEPFVDDFNQILDYFEGLDEIPEDVERSDDFENVMREDEVEASLPQEDVLENAPETEDGYVKAPKVSESD